MRTETDKLLAKFMKLPPVKWQDFIDGLSDMYRESLVKALDGLCEAAAFRGGYVARRYGYGCGDQGHKASVKNANRQARRVWVKALGYHCRGDVSF